jgi:lipid-binding SYLF domain-containing protein
LNFISKQSRQCLLFVLALLAANRVGRAELLTLPTPLIQTCPLMTPSIRIPPKINLLALSFMFRRCLAIGLATVLCGCISDNSSGPDMTDTIDSNATSALQELYAVNPAAQALGAKAKGVLVFPKVLKGGFMFGGQVGNGVLRQNGKTAGYYNMTAASYGFQAGLQEFGYALFFMNDAGLAYLHRSGGWEIGAGPSVVVVDEGMGRAISTTTLREDVYAFIFNQKGLMGGIGLQGSKITELHP